MAEALGHYVVREYIARGARGSSKPGEAEITIAPDTVMREQLAIGHELMELHLPALDGNREHLCQRGAAALLVPSRLFLRAMLACELDLRRLRRAFPLASAEVLGNRLVDLCPDSAFAVWDPERGYRRTSGLDACSSTRAEERVVSHLRDGATYACARVGGVTAQAFRARRRPQRALLLAVAH